MSEFTSCLAQRKRIHESIARSNKRWKIRMAAVVALCAVSAAVVIGTVVLLVRHPTTTEGVFLFCAAGFIFAFIPLICAVSIKNAAKYSCAYPYSSYANSSLTIDGDTLEYTYWLAGRDMRAAYSVPGDSFDKKWCFKYSINAHDIESLEIRDEICFIKGTGIKIAPAEYTDEDEDKTEWVNEFSFVLDFDNPKAERELISLKERAGR